MGQLTATCNSMSGDLMPSSGFQGHQAHTWCTGVSKALIHIKILNFFNFQIFRGVCVCVIYYGVQRRSPVVGVTDSCERPDMGARK